MSETIYRNVISVDFIRRFNALIDKNRYEDSLWIFSRDNPNLISEIRNDLAGHKSIQPFINSDSYVVVRCVKDSDRRSCYAAHFDSYEETLVIPILVPNSEMAGELYAWFDARSSPRTVMGHVFTKALFQNRFSRWFILRFFASRFKKVDVRVGDAACFNGFTTFHFNRAVIGERRSILIHNKRKFPESKLTALIEAFSRYTVK